nr:MFS transporter [Massilia sp. Dwa41.01b]
MFSPLMQFLIAGPGWIVAMFTMAATTLLTIPLAWLMKGRRAAAGSVAAAGAAPIAGIGLTQQLREALRDRSYLFLHAGFFTCGFHIAFLVTHLPGEVALCGLPVGVAGTALGLIGLFNIAGSLAAGALSTRYRMKNLLALMYFARAVIIALYLLAPKTALTFYVLAAALGFTWLATVPPTAGPGGQAVRYALPGHAVRPDAAVAPGWRLLRRLAGRPVLRALWRLQLDVVRRHRPWRWPPPRSTCRSARRRCRAAWRRRRRPEVARDPGPTERWPCTRCRTRAAGACASRRCPGRPSRRRCGCSARAP